MGRLQYFAKRLLLIVPTFVGITFVCFFICRLLPGGPAEQYILQMRGGLGGEAGGGRAASRSMSEDNLAQIRAYYGYDKSIPAAYWEWLVEHRIGMTGLSRTSFPGKTAWELICQRLPVSLTFGLTGFLLSYLICIPLGIAKALRKDTPFDVASSVAVFIGYSIPVFAFGMVLRMLLCGLIDGWPAIFPYGGFVSEGFDSMGFWGKAGDIARHMFLPVLCYTIGDFAFLTLLMKNSLLEEISKDYVRTARAKGCSVRRAVWGHALRNALIPIATGFGGVLTIMFAGSILIEPIFEIHGMGTLNLLALQNRDYIIFMGSLSLTTILGLLGNVLSDFCYVLIDPRIDFAK